MPSGDGSIMFFELNATVYSRWPCAPGVSTNRTRPSGLATVTSAAAGSDKQNRANGHRMVVFIDTVIPHSQLPRDRSGGDAWWKRPRGFSGRIRSGRQQLPGHPLLLEGLMQEHLHVGLVRQTLAVREPLGGLQIPHRYPDGDALGLRNAPQQAPFLGCLLELLDDEVGVGVPPGRLRSEERRGGEECRSRWS